MYLNWETFASGWQIFSVSNILWVWAWVSGSFYSIDIESWMSDAKRSFVSSKDISDCSDRTGAEAASGYMQLTVFLMHVHSVSRTQGGSQLSPNCSVDWSSVIIPVVEACGGCILVGVDLGHRNVHRKWNAYLVCISESAWVPLWNNVCKNVINT